MADLYLSAKKKLAEAHDVIGDLEAEIAAFNATEPHERMVETDPEGLIQEHRVKLIRPLPERVADLTLEACKALRGALDLSAFAASKAAGSRRLLETCFPIARDKAGIAKVIAEKGGGLPGSVSQTFAAFKPYRGGNDLLWGLAAVETVDKHALIVPLGSVDSGLTFINNKTAPKVRWNARHNEIELGFFPIHGTFHRDINIFFSAAFGEVDTLAGRAVVPTLKEMAEEVEDIMGVLEEATKRVDLQTE
ncbi:MAG: hypothetical protein OEO83_16230 [Alphaproteobacteria bacterium]|nr:hypothetical protein [Alphaproteobacteria bacterium]